MGQKLSHSSPSISALVLPLLLNFISSSFYEPPPQAFLLLCLYMHLFSIPLSPGPPYLTLFLSLDPLNLPSLCPRDKWPTYISLLWLKGLVEIRNFPLLGTLSPAQNQKAVLVPMVAGGH